jgi:CRP-like cAMP-binding protein
VATYLIRKLERFARLSADDRRALERVAGERVRQLGPREDIIHEGDLPRHVNLILDGHACRYKVLEDGRRQIMAFFVPGDLCDLRVFVLGRMDHSIGTLSPVRLAEIPHDAIMELTDNHPRVTRALWWSALVDAATSREWTVNVGQRTAVERMAHLLCELFVRLRAVGLTRGDACELPMTQPELADALGLSAVHTNRVLQELRADGLIALRNGTLTVPDLEALQAVALFDPNYLHLDHEGQEFDANEG